MVEQLTLNSNSFRDLLLSHLVFWHCKITEYDNYESEMIGVRRNDISYGCCACGSGRVYGVRLYKIWEVIGEMRLMVKKKEKTRVDAG